MATADDETPTERAGVTRRLVVVTMAVAVAGFGGAAPWVVPDKCRWVGWVCAALLVPAGCVVAFQAVRGRAEDLREFTAGAFAESLAGEAVGTAAGAALFAAVVALISCLR